MTRPRRTLMLGLLFTGGGLFPIGLILAWFPWDLQSAGAWLALAGGTLTAIPVLMHLSWWLRAPLGRVRAFTEALVYTALVGLTLLAGGRLFEIHGRRIDLSADRWNTLHPASLTILRTVQTPVTLWAFVAPGDPAIPGLRPMLAAYQAASPHVTTHLFDPDERPADAARLGVRRAGVAVVEAGLRALTVRVLDEAHLSATIRRILAPPVRVGYTVDHGERTLDGASPSSLFRLGDALDVENFEPVPVRLAAGIPADLDVVAMLGPVRDLSRTARERLERHLDSGRQLLICLESRAEPQPVLDGLLARMGIEVPAGLLLELEHHAKNQPATLVLPVPDHHPVVGSPPPWVLPGCRAVDRIAATTGVLDWPLAATSGHSWLERDPAGNPTFDPAIDRKGPLAVARAVEASQGKPGWRALVVGNTLWLADPFLDLLGNRDVFFAGLRWLMGRDVVPVLPRTRSHRLMVLTEEVLDLMTIVTCFAMPFLAALTGSFVLLSHR